MRTSLSTLLSKIPTPLKLSIVILIIGITLGISITLYVQSICTPAHVVVLEQRRSALEAHINHWTAQKKACPKNWFTKCIQPAQTKIDSYQAELLAITQQLDEWR